MYNNVSACKRTPPRFKIWPRSLSKLFFVIVPNRFFKKSKNWMKIFYKIKSSILFFNCCRYKVMHQNRSRMHISIKQSVLRSKDVWASVDKLMMLAIQSGIVYTCSNHKNAQVTSHVASKLIKNTIHSILMT